MLHDPGPAGSARIDVPVPNGTCIVWDTRTVWAGQARLIKGRYGEQLAPLGAPEPALPPGSDPNEWQPITVSQAWLGSFGEHPAALRRMTLTGRIVMNAMASLYHILGYCNEIQLGQLAVLEIHEFHDVETAYGVFGAPVLEVVGFVDRDEDLFGPPLIAAPSPILGTAPAAPQQISAPAASPEPPVVETVKPPASDPLVRFRPAASKGGSRTPY
ncbi:MAG: hypothetical protein ACJ8AI_20260 [Rhodopila sp.]